MTQMRLLTTGDEEALDDFLRQFPDASMFLRSNLRAGGIVYRGREYQADYFAEVDGERILGIVAHAWNDCLLPLAPRRLNKLLDAVRPQLRRPVAGFIGPWDQICETRSAYELADAPTILCDRERIYTLDLRRMRVPETLTSGRVSCRHARNDDLERLGRWRLAYWLEITTDEETPALRDTLRDEIERLCRENVVWILMHDETPVAMSAFNARLPDCVQVGGVWTPPEWRGRGYARAVVAGSLKEAFDAGVPRAVLFTANPAAARAYTSIGFQPAGEYGLILLATPQRIK